MFDRSDLKEFDVGVEDVEVSLKPAVDIDRSACWFWKLSSGFSSEPSDGGSPKRISGGDSLEDANVTFGDAEVDTGAFCNTSIITVLVSPVSERIALDGKPIWLKKIK